MNVRQEAMKKERIRYVISGLKKFELTEAETQFISLAEQNLNQNVLLAAVVILMILSAWLYPNIVAWEEFQRDEKSHKIPNILWNKESYFLNYF